MIHFVLVLCTVSIFRVKEREKERGNEERGFWGGGRVLLLKEKKKGDLWKSIYFQGEEVKREGWSGSLLSLLLCYIKKGKSRE